MVKNNSLTVLFVSIITLSGFANALPAQQDILRIQTSDSKRGMDTGFSTLTSWRKGDANLHRVNGLIFVNGFETKNPTIAAEIAHKAANALNADINYDAPTERGALAEFTKDKAEFLISNKEGFDLVHITTRDYANQKIRYDIPNKTFSSAFVNVAIDLVYSAEVEFIEGFSSSINKKMVGGFVSVTIDDEPIIEIKTDGKSPEQLEKELAQLIGSKSHFSLTPIYPNYEEDRSRNYKHFDGGEVQLFNLNAKSITIDVADSGLGVLTKFSFPDVNKPTDVANKVPYIFGVLVTIFLSYLFYVMKIKIRKEDIQD
ncbi:MAG: hypothetical protein RL236_331 [Pseudomonadota bacterium]|jgi:hypothetical protein